MSTQNWPQKERKLFNELLQTYEQKQLSKGKKVADQILKKYPKHGETMSMKGLIMVHLGDRTSGIALIKEGMRENLTSHISWHVWALIQKGEHNYEGALKSYLQALQFDKDNFNIIRETSVLQTHARHYDGLVESRLSMLRLRPYVRIHWLGVALAYRLSGNLVEASRVLEHIEAFLRNVPVRDPEYGELIFFHLRILEDMGELQQALTLLNNNAQERLLLDRPVVIEFRARLLGKLKSTPDADSTQMAEWTQAAEQAWRELLDLNPDCHDYYKGFLANAGVDLDHLTEESRAKALEILDEFSTKRPKATAPRRLALTIAEGEVFKELVKPYLERALQKGIPSLFSDLKKLYTNLSKRQFIEDIVEDIRSKTSPKEIGSPSESPDPTYYLWTLYFLAQHYSSLQRYDKSLEVLSTAMEHTPTLPELYMTKARVLKRAGDPYGAVRAMDDSRKLDAQDRFVNTKSGKYRLRAGMLVEADAVFVMFTKVDSPASYTAPAVDLLEMQALHYLTEVGDTQRRLGKYNLALKTYYSIQKVFQTFRSDQFDFHLYAIRKSMLGPYAAMLKWEDDLHSHPAYMHAVVSTARIWIILFDDPSVGKALQPPEPSAELSKKELSKAKKAARKATVETSQDNDDASSQKARFKPNEDKGLEPPPAKDNDPDGLKLVLADDPLERASKFLDTLGQFGKDNVDVNTTIFDIATRQKKYLKAAQALRRAHTCDPHHPEVHLRIAQFTKKVAALADSEFAVIRPVLEESLAVMKPAEVTLEVFNSQYLQLHSSSPLAVLASAKVSRSLDSSREDVENLLLTVLGDAVKLRIEDALEILSYLHIIESPRADEFRIACGDKFPLSKVFKTAEEQDILRKQCIAPKDGDDVDKDVKD
ncbi:NMDA receptor-regulated protein 1-domain-containing protein [Melanogaster broomeanus]|nr:NMDA receptor-regulated protein 1-domain-containing protein [Melanogaster broomeanus]